MKSSRYLVGTALLFFTACSGSGTITLNGAGATFPNIIYQKWVSDYNKLHPGVRLNYQSIGSGGGVRQFSDGITDFGASDAPMGDSAIAAIDGNVYHIPTVLGAVVPTYNLPAVSRQLRFTPEILAGIFLGQITRWNDARLVAANPGVELPERNITVVHRSDGSGTTFIWVDYLSKVSDEWKNKVGTAKAVNWPVGLGGKGNEGVTGTVKQTEGALGYVELGYALLNNLPVGAVKNRAGNYIVPTIESVSEAARGAMEEMGPDTDFRVTLTAPPGEDAYPISSFTWLLVHKKYDDPIKAKALADFIWWAVSEGEDDAPALGYAPIPNQLKPWIADRLADIEAEGRKVWSRPAGGGPASD